jgi:hypothetical protein
MIYICVLAWLLDPKITAILIERWSAKVLHIDRVQPVARAREISRSGIYLLSLRESEFLNYRLAFVVQYNKSGEAILPIRVVP